MAVIAVASSLACGGHTAPPPSVPPSSWRDPPPRSPPVDPLPRAADEPVGALALGGSEAARAVVVDLLEAIAGGDTSAAEATLAERVESAAPARAEAPRTGVDRAALVRHWMTLARSARLDAAVPLSELVVAASVVVEPASHHYEPGALPPGVEEGDLVVRFAVTESGRRAFAGIASAGEGLFVVRPGAAPRIVAR